jgi:EAL and modified HD-GYP domain-containing signal transduction protein
MAESAKFLIGRQPILDRHNQIVAYELLFRSAESMVAAKLKNASHATANVIVSALSGIGLHELLGGKQGYINVDTELLLSDAIELLPKECIGFELQNSIKPDQRTISRCQQLRDAGFMLALDGHEYDPEYAGVYELVDSVKIDLMQTHTLPLAKQVKELRQYSVELVAERVDAQDVYDTCKQLGFDYFQGYFFARPTVLEKKSLSDSHATLLKLLRLLLSDALMSDIIDVFRGSPSLTYKLLLLVNSVAFGMTEKIRDIRHALTILGRQQVKRWVQLSLFSADANDSGDNPLVEMAAARASFMEELAANHPVLKDRYGATDQAFMVGILSLLSEIYNLSVEQMAGELNLSEEVLEALVGHKGVLGKMLELTITMERFELGAGAIGLQELGISLDEIIASQIKALRDGVVGR